MESNAFGCKVRRYEGETKRFCQTLRLQGSEEDIRMYEALHSEAQHWREIRDGIREVGILEMEIYRHEDVLVMIVEVPVDWDWDSAMARLATLPRQQEWEQTVAKYQVCNAGDTSDDKWKLMRRIFRLYD